MDIVLNGEPYTVQTEVNLAGLIDQLSLGDGRFAVEVNEEVIARSEYDNHRLHGGDRVEIVQAIGGG